jgi:hypothetical protein
MLIMKFFVIYIGKIDYSKILFEVLTRCDVQCNKNF